jgi:citrate lyase subunit alpha/citrate CoA-transferase
MLLMLNSLGREIPDYIEGLGNLKPFKGAFESAPEGNMKSPVIPNRQRTNDKVLSSLKEALEAVGIKDGMTLSFHHHLRNGDYVVGMVLDLIAEMGLRDMVIAPTALFPIHKSIIKHIESGVIRAIQGSVNGPIGRLASQGGLQVPVLLRSHGGRARAVEAGDLSIDVAFIAAPSADRYGNLNGTEGPSACGSLGYCVADAMYADNVIAITDNLLPYPLFPISVPQIYVDHVVKVDQIGDPAGIVSGTLKVTKDPLRLLIAENAAKVIEASGLIRDDFSFQTGAGGTSLAVADFVQTMMTDRNVTGSLGSGGITSYFVNMLENGLFRTLLDVQSFDMEAVRSLKANPGHLEMSASFYANPHNKGCAVDQLDAVILGATQVDTSFNVNVNTESDGVLLHGIGGHMDTAAGADLTIITTPLLRGRLPMVVDDVITVTSPGETIDAVVTERGIAVNPKRTELEQELVNAGLPVVNIHDLKNEAYRISGKPEEPEFTDRIAAVVEYRDGTVIDVVREVAR